MIKDISEYIHSIQATPNLYHPNVATKSIIKRINIKNFESAARTVFGDISWSFGDKYLAIDGDSLIYIIDTSSGNIIIQCPVMVSGKD